MNFVLQATNVQGLGTRLGGVRVGVRVRGGVRVSVRVRVRGGVMIW